MNFRPEMVEAIYRGRKTQTRRIADANPNSPWYREDCAFYVGRPDGYAICPGRGESAVGRLSLSEEPRLDYLGMMDDEAARSEGFSGFLDFRAYWERLHGDFDSNLRVWVVSFEPLEWDANRLGAMLAKLAEERKEAA